MWTAAGLGFPPAAFTKKWFGEEQSNCVYPQASVPVPGLCAQCPAQSRGLSRLCSVVIRWINGESPSHFPPTLLVLLSQSSLSPRTQAQDLGNFFLPMRTSPKRSFYPLHCIIFPPFLITRKPQNLCWIAWPHRPCFKFLIELWLKQSPSSLWPNYRKLNSYVDMFSCIHTCQGPREGKGARDREGAMRARLLFCLAEFIRNVQTPYRTFITN